MTPPKSHPPSHKNEAEPDSTGSAFFEDRENSRITFEAKVAMNSKHQTTRNHINIPYLNGLEERSVKI